MSWESGIYDTGMKSIYGYFQVLKTSCKLSREQNISQFAVGVAINLLIWLFTIQIVFLYFAPAMS